MPQIKAQRANGPAFMEPNGNAVYFTDKVVLAVNPVATDTLDFLIPAGVQVVDVSVQADDLDTNAGPTFVFGVGFGPVNTASALAANPTYFAAAGQTTAQTGGRLRCAFKPITFNEDVYLRLTVGTASATFAAGEIHVIVGANCVGVK